MDGEKNEAKVFRMPPYRRVLLFSFPQRSEKEDENRKRSAGLMDKPER